MSGSSGGVVFDLTVEPESLSRSEISGIRWAFAVSAVLAVVLGILVLVWPESTLTVLATLFGLYFLAAGVVHVARGILTGGAGVGGRVLSILLGVLLVIAGIIAIRNPLSSLALLTMVIGISWIIEGVVGLVETSHDSSKWFGWLFGIVAIVAGTVLLLTPIESLGVLVWIGGIFLVGSGVIQLVQAFTFGRRARTHSDSR